MFDWGFTEFALVAVVGLLVFGPERLPEVARNTGRWVAKVRRYIANVRSDFESELNATELRSILGEQQEQIRALKGMVEDAKGDINDAIKEADSELAAAEDTWRADFEESLKDSAGPVSTDQDASVSEEQAAKPANKEIGNSPDA